MRPRVVLLLLLLCIASSAVVHAQTLESAYSVTLTGKQTVPGPRGDRIVQVRIGTKDVVEQFGAALGVSGKGMRLVVQRPISDLALESAREFLVVGGEYHEVGGTAETLPMPGTFLGRTTRSALGPAYLESWRSEEATGAFRMGSDEPGSSELVFSALVTRKLRLLMDHGVALGYRHSRLVWEIHGGLVDPEGNVMPVSGKLVLGAERVVAP